MTPLDRVQAALPLVRANLATIERPDRLARALLAAWPYGTGIVAAAAASAARYPHAPAVIGPDEQVSYRELWRDATSLARGLAEDGVTTDSRVALLARNSPLFVRAVLAVAMIGADLVLLNTGMGPVQLAETITAEMADVLLHDDEFAESAGTVRAYGTAALRAMSAARHVHRLAPPPRQSRIVILTSGTTGRPKGAARSSGGAVEAVGAVLGTIPLRVRDTMVVPAPFFHAWGLAVTLIGLGLAATVVTAPSFDPKQVLEQVESHRARVLVVVPTMLQRVCSLPPDVLASIDADSLRIIASSGSALPGRLATEVLDRFGSVLYNVYGSTEVATATIATPHDLRAAPTTAGRRATGVRLAILDENGKQVPHGTTGRIFVGNPGRFDGYTDGGGKASVRGLLSSGDLGHLDEHGRLFVDGREDDMIVSGGENVYPVEVEEVLGNHPGVEEAVVVAVPNEEFGCAMKAFVVRGRDHDVSAEELKHYLAQKLAGYKVPREFAFVDEFPRTPTGKIKRRELS